MFDRFLERIHTRFLSARARRLSHSWHIPGHYERIYHYHIRKTAGTSLNSAFWGLAGLDLASARGGRIFANNLVYVRHNQELIEEGAWFFANSHIPAHCLKLPPNTFTVTVIRDPLRRLISHYRYLVWARDDAANARRLDPAYSSLRREIAWLGDSFAEFLTRIPKRHALAQLYMFSKEYDVKDALERIHSCTSVCLTERFAEGIQLLANTLQLPLEVRRERQFGSPVKLSRSEEDRARELLEPESTFIETISKERFFGAP